MRLKRMRAVSQAMGGKRFLVTFFERIYRPGSIYNTYKTLQLPLHKQCFCYHKRNELFRNSQKVP